MNAKKLIWTVIIAVMLFIAPVWGQAVEMQDYINDRCKTSCVTAQELLKAVYLASTHLKIDPLALLAIIQVESRFNSKARNGSSVGLTQALYRLHKDKFVGTDPYNVKDNVYVGAKVLSSCLIKHKQNYDIAYRCYNGYGKRSYAYRVKVKKAYTEISQIDFDGIEEDSLQKWVDEFLTQEGTNV